MPHGHRPSISSLVLFAVVATTLLLPATPAVAATTAWDPHDMTTRFDLRWVGTARQDADTIRLTIRLWHPVRREHVDVHHGIQISLNPFDRDADAWVHPREGGGWVARFYDDGFREALFHARVTHPEGDLFRLWLPAHWTSGEAIRVNAIAYATYDRVEVVAP